MLRKKKIKFDDYVLMVRSRAGDFSRWYRINYEEMESEGFLIFCKAIKEFNPARASFSTYLYRRLSGQLKDYCMSVRKKARKADKIFQTTICVQETFERSFDEIPLSESFMDYARDYLSPASYRILEWLVGMEWVCAGSNRKPTPAQVAKVFKVRTDVVREFWEELDVFWKVKGLSFFGAY